MADLATNFTDSTQTPTIHAAAHNDANTRVNQMGGIEVFASEGDLAVKVGKGRFRWPFAVEILGVALTANTPPTGAAAIIDVNKAAAASLATLSTIYTTQGNRPTIADGAYAGAETVPDVAAFAAGDHMTVDIDQIGSTVAGADLVVHVRYKRTF